VSIARGYGCHAAQVTGLYALKQAVATAWTTQTPTVLPIPISPRSRR
jgi:thiamine pyrophosphate-dependent acetolactate synthase large subunit-like protein